ncbi:hypothetical protein [Nonomuraea sp. NPDC050310]|uniref:hypothetical protein n=1 Tax=unclassified Nonomuraea TaxID=2593643 RepID=UPI0033EB7999
MSNSLDLSAWPLVQAAQAGRMTLDDAAELETGMRALLARAQAENRRFALVVDQRERRAPEKGALEGVHAFWDAHAEEIATWCLAYASVVATPDLAALVVNPGPGGLVVFGTTDHEEAVSWAKERLAA